MRLRTKIAAVIGACLLAAGCATASTSASATTAPPPGNLYGCITSTRTIAHAYTTEAGFTAFLNANGGKCPSGFAFSVVSGKPGPTPTPTPTATTPTPTPTTTTAFKCTVKLGDSCGGYEYAGIPNSNGFNTYVSNQDVGANTGTTETAYANNPGDWKIVADAVPYGYEGVQTFPDVQQLFNNWGTNGWNGDKDTPLDSLSALKVNYSESGPSDAKSLYEFAPDVWSDNYANDVMFWADTHGRCNSGAYGDTVLGTAVIDGQTWTVNRYGDFGDEIIFVLDSDPNVPNSCAHQTSGTIDIKAGFDWLTSHGFVKGPEVIGQLNTGWEITSADKTTFTMNSYSITATPK